MIKEFSVKNYLSFKDESVFTFEADGNNVSEFPEHIVKIGSNNLLKVSSLYGPNAAGKSNLLKAFHYISELVRKGFTDLSKVEAGRYIFEDSTDFDNFAFTTKRNNTIEFKLFTVDDKYEIGYEIHILNVNAQTTIISYENLSYRRIDSKSDVFLFERKQNNFNFSEALQKYLIKDFKISDGITFVSFVQQFLVAELEENEETIDVFGRFYNEVTSFTFISAYKSYINLKSSLVSEFYKNEQKRSKR